MNMSIFCLYYQKKEYNSIFIKLVIYKYISCSFLLIFYLSLFPCSTFLSRASLYISWTISCLITSPSSLISSLKDFTVVGSGVVGSGNAGFFVNKLLKDSHLLGAPASLFPNNPLNVSHFDWLTVVGAGAVGAGAVAVATGATLYRLSLAYV